MHQHAESRYYAYVLALGKSQSAPIKPRNRQGRKSGKKEDDKEVNPKNRPKPTSEIEDYTQRLEKEIPSGSKLSQMYWLLFFLDLKIIETDSTEVQLDKQVRLQKWKAEKLANYAESKEQQTGMNFHIIFFEFFSYGLKFSVFHSDRL